MDYTQMTTEELINLITIVQELLDGKYGDLTEHNKSVLLQKLRDVKLEKYINRQTKIPASSRQSLQSNRATAFLPRAGFNMDKF